MTDHPSRADVNARVDARLADIAEYIATGNYGALPDAGQATEGRSALSGATNGVGSVGLDPRNSPRPSASYGCGGCNSLWNGVSRCHCAACHETFGGIGLFDRHRRDVRGIGTCLDPETIVSPKTGKREMFLTDGLWQGIETPTPRGQHLRKAQS